MFECYDGHSPSAHGPDVGQRRREGRYFAFLVAQGYELAAVEKLYLAKQARRRTVADKAA